MYLKKQAFQHFTSLFSFGGLFKCEALSQSQLTKDKNITKLCDRFINLKFTFAHSRTPKQGIRDGRTLTLKIKVQSTPFNCLLVDDKPDFCN